MGLLIQGGEIVTAEGRSFADLYIENESITSIGTNLAVPAGTEAIDATGKMIFPGFIDPHVHIHLPFMATFAKDTHATASVAGLIGGTTTYIEMVCPARHEDALEGYNTWKHKAEGNSACDYTFHMSVTKFDDHTEGQLREIVADGITLLLIEHQMDMIARLCDHVIVMADGRRLTEGTFDEVAADGAVQDAYMGGKRWVS